MNHDYAHCWDYDPAECPKECFRAQLVEDLRKRKDLIGIPVAWINFRYLPECALNRQKPTNADRIRSMSNDGLANSIVKTYGEGEVCPPNHTHIFCALDSGCSKCWLDWLKQEVDE